MLTGIRKSVNSYVTKILMLMLVLSFITFYGYQNVSGCHPNAVAKVHGRLIHQRDYRVRLQNQLEQFRRIFNRELDENMIGMVQRSVLERMINEQLLVKEASAAQLRISDEAVRLQVEQMFRDESGKFNHETYKKYVSVYLRQAPHQFEEQQRDSLLAQKIQDWISQSAKVSDAEVEEKLKFERREVNLNFLTLSEKGMGQVAEASDAELADYFKKHEAEYKSELARQIDYAYFEMPPEAGKAAGKAKVGANADPKEDAELKARAEKFAMSAKASSNLSFAEVLKASGVQGSVGKSDFVSQQGVIQNVKDSPMLTGRMFDLKPREISEPLKGWISGGYYIIRVVDERAPKPLTFVEAKTRVRSNFIEEAKTTRAEKLMDEAAKALKEGKSLVDIAKSSDYQEGETGFFKVAAVSTIPKVGFSAEAVKELSGFTLQPGGKSRSDRAFKIGNSHYLFTLKEEKGATPSDIQAVMATEKQQLLTQKQSQMQSAWITGLRQQAEKSGDVQMLMSGSGDEQMPESE